MSELRETLINITEEKNAKIIPSNIKEGVQIFDVVGEYKGLDTSDGTITASDIAEGKVGYSNGEKIIGTVETIVGTTEHQGQDIQVIDNAITGKYTFTDSMLFKENASHSLSLPQTQIVEVIGLTGNKIVKGNTVLGVEGEAEIIDTSNATAKVDDIAAGKTAYVNGEKITGNVQTIQKNYSSVATVSSITPQDNANEIDILSKYNNNMLFKTGSYILTRPTYQQMANAINLTSDKIIPGQSILGIEGTADILDTSDATAIPSDLLKDKVAYVNGEKIVGTIEPLPELIEIRDTTLSVSADINQLQIEGNIDANGIITDTAIIKMGADGNQVADAIGLAPDMIKAGTNVLGVEGTYSGDSGEYNGKLEIPEGVTTAPGPLAMITSVESLDTSKLTSIVNLFHGCSSLKSLPVMNLNNASSALYAFKNCYNLIYTPSLYMPKVHTLTSMFENCYNISYINLNYISPNYMHYFGNMYSNCYSLKELPDLVYNNAADYSNMCRNCWNLTSVNFKGVQGYNRSDPYLVGMFENCINLRTFDGFYTDPYHYLSNTYAYNMFNNCTNLIQVSNMNIYNGYHYTNNMFHNCVNLTTLSNFKFSFTGSANHTFKNCYNLVNAFENGYIHISAERGAYNTFDNCYNLRFNNGWVNATLIGGNYGGVSYCFANCHSITSANVLTSARNYGVYYAFYNCTNLTEANITLNGATSGLFMNCPNLKRVFINHSVLSGYPNFFTNCTSLDDISNSIINLSWTGLTSGYGMFTGCTGMKNFGVPVVLGYNTDNMFNACTNLTDMSNTVITEARFTANMFRDCINLQKACELRIENNASSRPVFSNMYVNCISLTDVPAIVFTNSINVSNSYAYIAPFGVYNAVINGTILPLHNLVNFGGFINYGIHAKYDMGGVNNSMKAVDIVAAPNLSYQSLQNVINGVYNLYTAYGIAAGGTLTYPQLIRMANTQYEKLTEDDIGILTSKGWNITVHNIGG